MRKFGCFEEREVIILSFSLLSNSPSVLFVIGLGLITVFTGLVCIIIICYIMGFIVRLFEKPKTQVAPASVPAANDLSVTNRGEFIAAVSAAIAEESGTDASGIRIVSVKKL